MYHPHKPRSISTSDPQGESVWSTRMPWPAVLSLPSSPCHTCVSAVIEAAKSATSALHSRRCRTSRLAWCFLRTPTVVADAEPRPVAAEVRNLPSKNSLQRFAGNKSCNRKARLALVKLAAGAPRNEIKQPLTEFWVFRLFCRRRSLPEKPATTRGKIREQARRTKRWSGIFLFCPSGGLPNDFVGY